MTLKLKTSLLNFVDNKKAQVLIDIEPRKMIQEMLILINWKLKNILEEEFIDLVFERDYVLENGKTISRIWVEKLGECE
jgi:hypothetical protein